jgi:hypothetical protein
VQVGHGDQPVEIVEMAGALPAAAAVEQVHRRRQTDGIADHFEHGARRAVATGLDDETHVGGEVEHLGDVLVRDALGDALDRVDGPGPASGHPL